MLSKTVLIAALLGLSLLLGATVYESVVMAPNYERDVPASIETAREFMTAITPASYFRVLAPVTQLLLLLCVIVCWKARPVRWLALTTLGALLIADVITFTFHYPRLAIMFELPITDPDQVRTAAHQWATGNVVRAALLLAAWVSLVGGLKRMTAQSGSN